MVGQLILRTVDGRNPKQPPEMVLKPCKLWDIYGICAEFLPSTVDCPIFVGVELKGCCLVPQRPQFWDSHMGPERLCLKPPGIEIVRI